jgi:elongation factor Ts
VQFYEENCLLEQKYVLDMTKKVSKVVEETGGSLDAKLEVIDFVRFQCGEGLEKEQSNFADDVAQTLQQTASA